MDLKEFVSGRYDTNAFERFITERFYGFEPSLTEHTAEDLSESERKHIQSYRYLGSVELDDAREIGFFEFLSASPQIENKRVGYNAILKKLANDYALDGAIASFYHPDSYAWRLSFVGFEYDEGRVNVTNLKRYTYVLGEGIPHKTAYIQLKKIKYPTFEELLEAFGVEKVSQEFYEKYKALFEMLNDYLKEGQYNYFNRNESELHAFTKKLLGRIIFLYFLQKKGWLGVDNDQKWGEGDKNFLTNALKSGKYDNFYDDFLKAIFFEALNTKRSDDFFELTGNRIPFLNGGLFEKDPYDEIEGLYLENRLFEKIFRTFNEYNFTIIEDSPDDKEVAIDPEMMGRVFENLLEENYRKGKGAFYTPREIVHYMCRQSIIHYLTTYFPEKEKIVDLVIHKTTDNDYFLQHGKEIKKRLLQMKILDPAIGSGAFPMGMLHEIVTVLIHLDKTQSPEEIALLKRSVIENSIYGVDIDASAVEVAKLRFWLSLVVDEEVPTPLPNLYYKIMVGNSLLETIMGFEPLPKDTSTLFDDSGEKIREIQEYLHEFYNTNDRDTKHELKEKIEHTIDSILNKQLEEQEEVIQSQLNNMSVLNGVNRQQQEQIEKAMQLKAIIERVKHRPTTELFFYKIYFAEVLNSGGFDVVIGNPPYIRQEKIKELKPRLQSEKFYNPIMQQFEKYECFNGTADIYIYFFEKGCRLLKEQGTLSFITSNKYTRAKYGKPFRKFVLKHTRILEYIDFNGVKVFESATVDTSILSFKKAKATHNRFLYCDVDKSYRKGEDLAQFVAKHGFKYAQDDLSEDGFSFANPKELAIKKRIEEVGTPLKEWDINIFRGILTGYNEAFVIDSETKDKLIAEDPKSAKIIKPLLRGKDIKKYSYEFADKWLIYVPWHFPNHLEDSNADFQYNEECFKKEYPAIYSYLLIHKNKLSARNKAETGIRYEWYALQRWGSDYWQEFEKEKVIYPVIASQNIFAYDKNHMYHNDKVFHIVGEDVKYLVSLLNSKVVYWLILKLCSSLGEKGFEQRKIYIEQLSIPMLNKNKQKPFEKLVDTILELKKQKDIRVAFFEKIIDVMVYELYFKQELHEKGFGILDVVAKELKEGLSVDELYERWTDSKHPIKYNVDFIDSVDVVRTIEEAL